MSNINILSLQKSKQKAKPITMVTCYDYWTARILDKTDIDCVLVGDSLAMVMHGFDSTIPATVELMKIHVEAVARGMEKKLIVADMPFMSVRKGLTTAMEAVQTLMQAGAHAIKIEGVDGHEEIIRHITQSGVPVMGHLGLTPQSVHAFGGFQVQGRSSGAADHMVFQARRLEEAGCFAVVLECVPAELARNITETINIPTIGIGAGKDVSGQVLVLQDLLGANLEFKPKFLRRYAQLEEIVQAAVQSYVHDVEAQKFPSHDESYS